MMLIILSTLISIVILLFVGLRWIAPAITRTNHKIKNPGIDRMEIVEIGGIQQALYIRGHNVDNPIILWVHGGPGNSMLPLLHLYQYEWENDFTVVNWDQRNVGKTFFANDPSKVLQTMNAERVLNDVHEVTAYLKKCFNKEKIILVGHSWGSVLGTMAVQTYPEDYSAYIGISQVIKMSDNERVGYEKTFETALLKKKQKDIKALEAVAPYPPSKFDSKYMDDMMIVRAFQSKYGLSVNMGFGDVIRILATPYYSFKELRQSFIFNQHNVFLNQGNIVQFLMEEADIENYGVHYQVPVYYIMGENDYNSPYILAEKFFDKIVAPNKQIFSIQNADHMPFLSQKIEFNHILLGKIAPELVNRN